MTIQNRMEKLPPTVNWIALPLLLNEVEAADALGVSVSLLMRERLEKTRGWSR